MVRRRSAFKKETVTAKANKILNGILIALLLIFIRIWQLAVVQHDELTEASKKPQKRIVVERAERGTIRDRFDLLMAANKASYRASVCYNEIREIPRCLWIKDSKGSKRKIFRRKEYISQLSSLISKELGLDSLRIEDLIHSKAAILGSVPFIVKEDISEKQYFRIKMLERQWPGLRAEIVAKRWYPQGEVGSEVIGYLGAINAQEYDQMSSDLKRLRLVYEQWKDGELPSAVEEFSTIEDLQARLRKLEAKAYTLSDFIGKAGVEGAFDEQLRGSRGKKIYLSDFKGNYLRELPGAEEPVSGNRLYLSISSELQQYAEMLLAEYEQKREGKLLQGLKKEAVIPPLQPWIKGGAIVAMNPQTGEIYALASYPRFNPNDFIPIRQQEDNQQRTRLVQRWLETEVFLGNLWDQKEALEREKFDLKEGKFFVEQLTLTWSNYLDLILPQKSPVRLTLNGKKTIGDALFVQEKIKKLLRCFEGIQGGGSLPKVLDIVYTGDDVGFTSSVITLQEKEALFLVKEDNKEEILSIKNELSPYFYSLPLNDDKLFLIDLYQLAIEDSKVSEALKSSISEMDIENFRQDCVTFTFLKDQMKEWMKEAFHHLHFLKWREDSFKQYLALKRKEEVLAKKKNPRPYIDYLDEAEKMLFTSFWKTWEEIFYAHFFNLPEAEFHREIGNYLTLLLQKKREMHASFLKKSSALEEMLCRFSPAIGIQYLQALRGFEDLNRPLYGKYIGLRASQLATEKDLAMAFYPKYGYGFTRSQAFREGTTIGSIFKLVTGYEAIRQKSLQKTSKSAVELNPLVMVDDKQRISNKQGWIVGYTTEGVPIPQFYHGGRLPRSEHAKVGKIDLIKAIETSSNPYFGLLAGEVLSDPEDLNEAARMLGFGEKTEIDLIGEISGFLPPDLAYNRTGLYSTSIGQHMLVGTPLQTSVMLGALANGGKILKPKIVTKMIEKGACRTVPTTVKRELYYTPSMRHLLLTGLKQVIHGEKGTGRRLKNSFSPNLLSHIIGKTSTAEVVERFGVGVNGSAKCKVIWFGAVSFESIESEKFENPDLVVVVYLRFGEYGWEAAPLAVKMISKWNEIKTKYKKTA